MATTAATSAPPAGQEVKHSALVEKTTAGSNGPLTDSRLQHSSAHDSDRQHSSHEHKVNHENGDVGSRPQRRQVVLQRHPETGFGFIAGSDKPVIVRFVRDGGPSEGQLQAEDQILEINGEDVSKAPRQYVIELVKSCKQTLTMTVCQPDRTCSTTDRKSSLLTAAKRAKLKDRPSRVRFAEAVLVNGTNTPSIYSSFDSCVPFMPNVLKVFLENGQTKTFKYDTTTLVQDVLNSLVEKLSIKNPLYLSLCVEHVKIRRRNKLILLDPKDSLFRIANRSGAHNLRCLFRVVFVPKDISELLLNDAVTFEYFYAQCCNDIVQERFAPELKYEIALRLSALHLLQHASQTGMMSNNGSKVNVKAIERESSLKAFVPYTLIETMKSKELNKLLQHYMKQNHSQLCPPGQKSLTAIQAKVHYLRIISELPSYGAKVFPMNIRETVIESAVLVSRKYGLSHVANLRNSMPVTLARIEDIISVRLSNHPAFYHYVAVEVHLRNNTGEVPFLRFALEENDAEEFVLMVQGYHRLILTPQATDLPYKELPVFSDVVRDPPLISSSSTWKKASGEPESHDSVKFADSNSLTEKRTDEDEERNGLRISRRHSSPPPQPQYQSLDDARDTTSDGKAESGDDVLSSCNQKVGKRSAADSPTPTNQWILSRSAARNSTAVHSCSRSSNARSDSSPPASGVETTTAAGGRRSGTHHEEEEDIDLPSIVSMEILESAIIAEKRIKREEVEQRVAEMHRIVADAQHYLTETSDSTGIGFHHRVREDRGISHCKNQETQISDDSESMKSDPEFIATDSLLLIRHTTGELVPASSLTGDKCQQTGSGFSESDTTSDSFSNGSAASPLDRTPNGSFKGLTRDASALAEQLERTFSHAVIANGGLNSIDEYSGSRGQHSRPDEDESPDASEAHPNLSDAENELIETLRRLQTEDVETYMQSPIMNGNSILASVTSDVEIIDLTALPPPGEEVEDHYDNLQNLCLAGDGGVFVGPVETMSDNCGVEYANFSGPASISLISHSNGHVSTPHTTLTRVRRNGYESVRAGSVSSSSGSAVTASDSNQIERRMTSIDDFIASVAMPPPPQALTARRDVMRHDLQQLENEEDDNEDEDEEDDLSSLIVPPPPVQETFYPQDDVIAKFWQVTDDVKKIYETLPLPRKAATNSISSSAAGLLQVSPKSGTRELHSSSSGDSGYDSIPVMTAVNIASASSVCQTHSSAAVPGAIDCDPFTLRLFLSAAGGSGVPHQSVNGKGVSHRSVSLRGEESVESNHENEITGREQGTSAMNNSVACNTASGSECVASASLATIHSLPTFPIVRLSNGGSANLPLDANIVKSSLPSSTCDANAAEAVLRGGLPVARGKKVPPPPPVRSKPPIPPTSPSIIERRRQLAKRAQTKAKLGMMPVSESSDGMDGGADGEEDEERKAGKEMEEEDRMALCAEGPSSAQVVSASGAREQRTGVFNEERRLADATASAISSGGDNSAYPSSCLSDHSFDRSSSFSECKTQQRQLQHCASLCHTGSQWNDTQPENVIDADTLFIQVQANIDHLLIRLEDVHESRLRSDPSVTGRNYCDEKVLNQRKDELIIESRAFVTSSKLFVKCATDGSPQVIDHLLDCLSLVDHMCKVAEFIVMSTESQAQVTCLVDRLKEVAATFGYTVQTVHRLTQPDITVSNEKEGSDTFCPSVPSMNQLMSHATSLATSLSALMRTLRSLSSY